MHKESPYNATSRALFKEKKKISNGRSAPWPKALLENQKMWVANYFKYPQQVKLDVEKYVPNIYFCLWCNWNQMTPNNILCERVINQLQMEPNCWSFTFAALIISIQLKEKVSWGVIWDGPSHQSLQMHPQHCRLDPAKELSVLHSSMERCWLSPGHRTGSWCRTSYWGSAGGGEVRVLLPWTAVACWFSSMVSLPHLCHGSPLLLAPPQMLSQSGFMLLWRLHQRSPSETTWTWTSLQLCCLALPQ